MAAVVDRFEFKRLVLKATPRVGSAEESKENSFWRKFKVGGTMRAFFFGSACGLCVFYALILRFLVPHRFQGSWGGHEHSLLSH